MPAHVFLLRGSVIVPPSKRPGQEELSYCELSSTSLTPLAVPNLSTQAAICTRIASFVHCRPRLYVDLTFHIFSLMFTSFTARRSIVFSYLPGYHIIIQPASVGFLARFRCRSKDFRSQKRVTAFKRPLLHTISGMKKARRKTNELHIWRLATRNPFSMLHACTMPRCMQKMLEGWDD